MWLMLDSGTVERNKYESDQNLTPLYLPPTSLFPTPPKVTKIK